MHTPGANIRSGVSDLVGDTPLVELSRLFGASGPRVLAKLEGRNPGGSAKDRPAAAMIAHALEEGLIGPGSTVVESSSGNLGVALAQQCRLQGLQFICVVDSRTSTTTRRLIELYGGTVHQVTEPDPMTGDWLVARLDAVQRIVSRTPNAWWSNQYANPFNSAAHRDGTVREICEALGDAPTALYIATSSTGTLGGAQQLLRANGHATRLVAVDAVGSVLFGGMRGERKLPGIGAGIVPALAEYAEPDAVIRVSDLDCVVGCRRLARAEALLVGASAGGVIAAVASEIDRYGRDDVVALIFHDLGERYLETVFDDAWVSDNLGCDPDTVCALADVTQIGGHWGEDVA